MNAELLCAYALCSSSSSRLRPTNRMTHARPTGLPSQDSTSLDSSKALVPEAAAPWRDLWPRAGVPASARSQDVVPQRRMVDSLRLSRLSLRGFRNLEPLHFTPGPRFNVVHGDNG